MLTSRRLSRPGVWFSAKHIVLVFSFINVFVLLGITVLALRSTVSQTRRTPTRSKNDVLPRHVNNDLGPSGTLTILDRLRDAVGTAVQTWGFGPGRKHDIRHALASGPMPFVFRDTISAFSQPQCQQLGQQCELASHGFGTVGVVRYQFLGQRENIAGTSIQVQTACRCMGDDCNKAVLMRPVNITERNEDGTIHLTGKKSCIYQVFEGKFTDCHSETLRMQRKERVDHTINGLFIFEVDAMQHGHGSWTAVGHRGWDYSCVEEDFYSLPTVNMSSMVNNISSEIQVYPRLRRGELPSQNQSEDCKPPPNVMYFRDAEEREGEECGASFQFAMASASFLGSQMDEVAVGKDKRTYLKEPPEILVFWEIMVLVCAASLGLYFAISACTKFKKKNQWTVQRVLKLVAVLLMSLLFEAMPLHFALSFEVKALQWIGRFAYLGATVALGKDVVQPQSAVHGNILVLTAIVGESRFVSTSLLAVAMLSAFINVASLLILSGVICTSFIKQRRSAQNEPLSDDITNALKTGKSEDETRLSSSSLMSVSFDSHGGDEMNELER
ncbi:unnamed protein product [Agarophyton chilense]|eukprot:gb/GEZJ01003485.1/.p1 GENE.gb/GEZJ01003485.1/~~gb/GEZJ01003485.1/.p1  ORF type:complete len:556 (-),score=65.12 gb/GEZJ01003485.1/:693-2360(-)